AVTSGSFIVIGSSGSRGDIIKTGSGNDEITGAGGADTMSGGGGADTFFINSGDAAVSITGGNISGYDVITDFSPTADFLDRAGTPAAAANTAGTNGADSTLKIGGQTVKSHSISNGIITFDDDN